MPDNNDNKTTRKYGKRAKRKKVPYKNQPGYMTTQERSNQKQTPQEPDNNDLRNIPLSKRDLIIWSDFIAGISKEETAQRLGVTTRTVQNRRKMMRKEIETDVNIDVYRNPLLKLYPDWLKALQDKIASGDARVLLGYGKGMGLFIDKAQIEEINAGKMSDSDIEAGINDTLRKLGIPTKTA